MKFEKLLQVYWLKGFLYGGEVTPFEVRFNSLSKDLPGFAKYSMAIIARRLELSTEPTSNPLCVELPDVELRTMNVLFSHAASVNVSLFEYEQKAAVRYYLIKTYRGRCQALGKPSRGQRTWSNASTAFKTGNHIKSYISHFKKTHIKVEVSKKINYRIVQRKPLKTAPKFIKKAERKPITVWL